MIIESMAFRLRQCRWGPTLPFARYGSTSNALTSPNLSFPHPWNKKSRSLCIVSFQDWSARRHSALRKRGLFVLVCFPAHCDCSINISEGKWNFMFSFHFKKYFSLFNLSFSHLLLSPWDRQIIKAILNYLCSPLGLPRKQTASCGRFCQQHPLSCQHRATNTTMKVCKSRLVFSGDSLTVKREKQASNGNINTLNK